MEGPEVHTPHTPHPHGGLPRWLELLIAVTALVTSISSIVIALHHGQTMEKLVEANSIPWLEAAPSNASPEGVSRISLDLYNRGVGPAYEHSLKLQVGDKPITSLDSLMAAVFGPAEAPAAAKALRSFNNTNHERFIPGGASQLVFAIAKTDANAAQWDKLSASLDSWHIEYCYCSVFEDCWQVRDEARRKVKACHRDEAAEFKP